MFNCISIFMGLFLFLVQLDAMASSTNECMGALSSPKYSDSKNTKLQNRFATSESFNGLNKEFAEKIQQALAKRITLKPQTASEAINCRFCLSRLLNQLDKKLRNGTPWEFTLEDEAKFQEIINSSFDTESQRVEKLYEAITLFRFEKQSKLQKYFTRSAFEDALKQKSIYSRTLGKIIGFIAGPHFNSIFNRVTLPLPNDKNDLRAQDFLIAIHEIEHLLHRNKNPFIFGTIVKLFNLEIWMMLPTPIRPLLIRRTESRAIGAQWELLQRLTPEQKAQLYREFKTSPKAPLAGRQIEMIQYLKRSDHIPLGLYLLAKSRGINVEALSPTDFLHVVGAACEHSESSEFLSKEIKKSRYLSSEEKDFFDDFFTDGMGVIAQTIKLRRLQDLPLIHSPILHQIRSTKEFEDMLIFFISRNSTEIIQSSLEEIFVTSLEYSHLSKDEFIREVSKVHNYDLPALLKANYFGFWRIYLLIINSLFVGTSLWNGEEIPISQLTFDLRIYWSFLNMIFGN